MASIAHALSFNLTVFLEQIVLFVALLVVMNFVYWKPVLAHLAGREQAIADAYARQEALRHEMESLRADYLSRLAKIEADARGRIQAAIREAQSERERILAKARTQAEQAVRQGAEDMERDRVEALTSLRDQMAGLAVTAVTKSLGPTADAQAVRSIVQNRLAQE